MPVFKLARFVVRERAREEAERAMHAFATYVRGELPDSSWTTYRDPKAPNRYISVIVADDAMAEERHRNAPGTKTFMQALHPLLEGEVELVECQLVTSSDLGRRRRGASSAR